MGIVLPIRLKAICPYCESHQFLMEAPSVDKAGTNDPPRELECVPYTRDVGRFDPRPDELQGAWDRIGKDYYPQLDWERIGILRSVPGQRICYRVCRCPECGQLFDVYANYTPGQTLAQMWPHLFAPDTREPGGIAPYENMSPTQLFLSNFWRIAATVCLLYLLSFWPRLVTIGNIEVFLVTEWPDLMLRLIAAVGLALMFILDNVYLRLIKDEGFYKLFKVTRQRGIVHWQNYTLCRFTGFHQPGRLINLNPIMIFGGIPPMILLLFFWIDNNPPAASISGGVWGSLGIVLLLSGAISWLIHKAAQKQSNAITQSIKSRGWFSRRLQTLLWLCESVQIILLCVLAAFATWAGALITLALQGQGNLVIADRLVELLFWMILAYYVGKHAWSSAEIPVYVLKGLQRVPMHADPLENFDRLDPLERIGFFSTLGILVVFILTVALGTIQLFLPSLSPLLWLMPWLKASLVFYYLVLAIPLSANLRRDLLLSAILFIAIQLLLGTPQAPGLLPQSVGFLRTAIFGGQELFEYLSLATVGIFGSYITFVQSREIFGLLQAIKRRHKDEKISLYRNIIDLLERELRGLVSRPARVQGRDIPRLQRLIEAVQSVLALYQRVDSAAVSSRFYRRTIAILSPVVTALVAPILVNLVSGP